MITLNYCVVIVSLMALNALGKDNPSADQYLFGLQKLIPSFNKINLYDGPSMVSGAPITTPIKIKRPTREQMMYYNYYTGSINAGISVQTMECYYCAMIKGDIKNFVVLSNSTHDTLSIVALSEKRKEIVIAYRATLNYWNAILDLNIVNASPHGVNHRIKIHRGFYIAVMSLYDRIVKAVGAFRSKKEYASYKIVLTGHSLGAAMARVTQFFLLHLKQFPGINMEVYTYGEPRSGNKYYVDFLNQQNIKTSRICNRADFFCHVPPTSIIGTTAVIADYYYHVQNEYWINGNKESFANPSVYEDPNGANSLGPLYTTHDHFFYFDVNHLRLASEFQQILAVPDLFQPIEVLPPLPKPIQIGLSEIGILSRLLYPAYGR